MSLPGSDAVVVAGVAEPAKPLAAGVLAPLETAFIAPEATVDFSA